jgi:hypothetical protein
LTRTATTPFHQQLTKARADARMAARTLPIVST